MTRPSYKLAELLSKQRSLHSKNPGIEKILEDKKTQPNCGPREVYDQAHKNTYSRAVCKRSI